MMKPIPTIIAILLAGTCFAVGPRDEPQTPARAPRPGASRSDPAAEKKEAPERPEDVKAIRELGAAFTQAYNKGDARAIAATFSEQGEVTNESGVTIRGREAIADQFASAFEESPGEKIELKSESIVFLGPDIARETGVSHTIPDGIKASETTRYSALLVRSDGRWLQASVHEYPDRAPTPHERLKELEWLLGDWVDESDEGVVHTTCHWSEDKNYLIRDFTLRVAGQPAMSGSQRIGWDPLTRQFKSWVFDPDGGYNEALWCRNGTNQWIIKATGVLADGRTVAGTQVLTFMN
jgi:uncharacterized protein (TIGR02246 family)